MRRTFSIPLGIALAGAVTACTPRDDAEVGSSGDTLAADRPAPSDAAALDSVPAELLGTAWRLVEFDAGELVPEEIEITAEFRQGGIAGRSGCNRYTGPVRVDLAAGSIDVGALVSTKMACPPPQMDGETRYLGSLERATGITLETGRLVIRAQDEAGAGPTLAFAPLESP